MSVNYQGLANSRSGQGELLDCLLVHNILELMADGLIALAEVVLDGVRARAGAVASSARRRQVLHKHLKEAPRLVECLKLETAEAPEASNRRIKAALERVTREQRVTATSTSCARSRPRGSAAARPTGSRWPSGKSLAPRRAIARRAS